jgi:hypothetical protein
MQQVRSESPGAIDLFCLLGFLPGGMVGVDLTALCGGLGWYDNALLLEQKSLVVKRKETNNENIEIDKY